MLINTNKKLSSAIAGLFFTVHNTSSYILIYSSYMLKLYCMRSQSNQLMSKAEGIGPPVFDQKTRESFLLPSNFIFKGMFRMSISIEEEI